MANMQKYTRSQLGHLLKHYERALDENRQYVRFGNQNINIHKTYLNYNLAKTARNSHLSDYEFIKKRTEDLKALKRQDVKVMSSWVVTIPQKYLERAEYQDTFAFLDIGEKAYDKDRLNPYIEKFFQETYNFLEKKYGKENVVSAYVHLDETTPHMHFAFIPTVWDKQKQRYKVSAKECITQAELQKFHPDINRHLNQALKKELKELKLDDIGLLVNEDRGKQYQSLEELEVKVKTLEKDNKALQKELYEHKKTMSMIKYKDQTSILDKHKARMAKFQQNEILKPSKIKNVTQNNDIER